MAGHNKWSQIKRKKAAVDAKRGKTIHEANQRDYRFNTNRGGDPDANPRLRLALQAARESSMPKDNIERAIKRGTGELEGAAYEEVVYEAYGPGGVAIYIEATTDNKNRTLPELRTLLSKHGGNMANSGSVAWIFSKIGLIHVPVEGTNEDRLMEVAIDAGASDIQKRDDFFEIVSEPGNFIPLREAIEGAGFMLESADVTMVPQNTTQLEGKEAESMIKLMDALEEHDDVNRVYANFDLDDALIDKVSSQ